MKVWLHDISSATPPLDPIVRDLLPLGTRQRPDNCVQVRRVEIHEVKSIPSCVGVLAHIILALSSGLCLAVFPEPNSARVSCSQNGDNYYIRGGGGSE